MMPVRIGYASLNQTLRKQGIFVGRTMRLDTIRRRGLSAIHELALQNLDDLRRIIIWNEENGIRFYRMGGDIFPHMENEQIGRELMETYNLDFARDRLAAIGALARGYGHRLTFHPKQFAQLGSPRPEVVARTALDLNVHAGIFSAMGLTPGIGSVMVIHGGGSYGDKSATLQRWRDGFRSLPPATRQFVAVENDETQYSPQDLLPMCEDLDVPLVLDFFHYRCMFPDRYDDLLRDTELLDRISRTWTRRGIKQKVHLSSQRAGARRGTHDDYIDVAEMRVADVLRICERYDADIVCECSQKNLCALRILDEFFVREPTGHGRFHWTLINSAHR